MTRRCVAVLVLSGSGLLPLSAQTSRPASLDPLTAAEIRSAVSTIKASDHATDQTRFGTISVQPRSKTTNEPRAARVIGFDWKRNEGFVAVVDVEHAKIESWTKVDSEPPVRLLTIRRAEEIAHADSRWVAALTSRHIDTARVDVLVGLPERARLPRQGADRVVGTSTWLRDGVPDAFVVRGVQMSVNLTKGRVESFSDNGQAVRANDSSAFRALAKQRAALPPLEIRQPNGSAVRVDGNEIQWDRWRLRVGVDPRRGLEVHEVVYDDNGRQRSVLHSGSVSEVMAPYGDSEFSTWYPRDEGDYGMGIYSQSQAVELNDVPANARFLTATMHDHLGRPVTVPRAIAVYERDGGILWRHANTSRRARQLVISAHSTIDNYDYQFNWIFGQDGEIDGEVLLSGIMNVNPTGRKTDSSRAGAHEMQGHLVAPNVNAPNHQHFFSYRLDLDVDGRNNTVYAVDTRAVEKARNLKGELFAMHEMPLAAEREAISDVAFSSARSWRVANTHERNSLGQFTGYTLVPGAASPMFAMAGSEPVRTGGFATHQLWVTPYAPAELYAAGEFQNLGLDDQGLPAWTSANRPLTDTDVVLWYTLGITHLPRPEDWPYMPAHRGSFRLVPTSFFSRNPTLDVPAVSR